MATRILGQRRSRRRGRFLLAPIFLVAVVALFLSTGAQAVHDLGLFELDRNAENDAAVAGDDWDSLPGSSLDFTGILPDIAPLPGGTQFQGGGSKDDLDITSWLWKAGEPLDKDDITNAYAASYTNTVDSGENDVGDLIVYFGLDRFSTAGSAQVGFWFLQDPDFGLTNTPSGGGFRFSGQHQDNDVLVQSNFTNGGAISNLTVYKWMSGALVEVTSVSASDCVSSAPADDPACATVNQSPTDAPWDYTPRANEGPPGTFQTSAFFEGGINITRARAGCHLLRQLHGGDALVDSVRRAAQGLRPGPVRRVRGRYDDLTLERVYPARSVHHRQSRRLRLGAQRTNPDGVREVLHL
jgi:hypothetical protein